MINNTNTGSVKNDNTGDTCDNTHKKRSQYRFPFTPTFTEELSVFSRIHQFDHRKDFKEAWTAWVDKNKELVDSEYEKIKDSGYDGDIMDKMFKSARYYYRKKSLNELKAINPDECIKTMRREYTSCSNVFLCEIDKHIAKSLTNDQPAADVFRSFCIEKEELVKNEIAFLKSKGICDTDIIVKLKKTYKNKYFKQLKATNYDL